MILNSIISRTIFREMLPTFALGIGFFTFVFMMAKMLEITNMIVNYEVGLGVILLLICYTMPSFLVYIIPMSLMTAVLLTFMRMSGDNEIIAIKTGGGSIYGLLPPAVLFSLLGAALTVFMSVFASPWGLEASSKLAYQIAVSHADIGLKERTFNKKFKGVMLYVSAFDKHNGELSDVFIEDQRERDLVSTVVAHRGRLVSNPETQVYLLRLYNGTIIQTGLEKRSAHSVQFETYDIRLDARQAISAAKFLERKRPMMYVNELLQHIQEMSKKEDRTEFYKGLVELHKKFALPFACIALGLLAVPIGIQTRSSKRSTGLVVALILFLLYYLLLTGGIVSAEGGSVAPWIGMWVPNAVMGVVALFLLARTARERPIYSQSVTRFLRRLRVKDKSRTSGGGS